MKRANWGIIVALLAIMALPVMAQRPEVIEKSYEKLDELRIDLVLGDCRLIKSKDNKVKIRLEYTYDDQNFEARFRERSRKLIIEEKFYGRNTEGMALWEIAVPEGMEVDYKSATGDLALHGVHIEIKGQTGTGEIEILDSEGEFDLSSGTGDLEIENCKGEIEVHSGTGDIIIERCAGNFDVHSGTGNVDATEVTLEFEGNFNSGTGDAELKLPKGSEYDLTLGSGTGNAVLDMAGQPIVGYFELVCHKRRGRIRSDLPFDREEEIGQRDHSELVKSFTKGGKTPSYTVRTGTGRAILKK